MLNFERIRHVRVGFASFSGAGLNCAVKTLIFGLLWGSGAILAIKLPRVACTSSKFSYAPKYIVQANFGTFGNGQKSHKRANFLAGEFKSRAGNITNNWGSMSKSNYM